MNRQSLHPLLLVPIGVALAHFLFHNVRVLGMQTSIFYMDEVVTIAAFFTVGISIAAGFNFLQNKSKSYRLDWMQKLVGVGMILLAADEYFELHEAVHTEIKNLVGSGGSFGQLISYSWVLPLGVVLLAGAYFMLRYSQKLKSDTLQMRFRIGLLCFVMVLVLEVIQGFFYGQLAYLYLVGVEEFLEMLGATLIYLVSREV